MTTQQIRFFLTLVDVLSFSKTAEIHYTSQSTISKQIVQMESELNATLVERRPHQVALTPAGRAFVPYAHKILGELDITIDGLHKMTDLTSRLKQLDISCDHGFWDDVDLHDAIMNSFRSLRQIDPSFKVLHHSLPRGESVERLKGHQLDLRFVMLPDDDSAGSFGFPNEIGLKRLSKDQLGFAFLSDLIRDREQPLPEMDKLNLFIPSNSFRNLAHGLALCSKLSISPKICFFTQSEQGRFVLNMGMGMLLVTKHTYDTFISPRTKHTSFIGFDVPEGNVLRALLWSKDTENESTLRFLEELGQRIDAV